MILRLTGFLLIGVLFFGCAKEELFPEQDCELSEVYMYGTYTNYIGSQPTFTINTTLTSGYISYGQVTIDPDYNHLGENRVKISIPDITVQKDGISYNIDTSILAQEYKNDGWVVQSEFSQIIEPQQKNMAIVMVLDMSTSLGADVNTVKSSAINFAQEFFNKTEDLGQIGLVLFSTEVVTFDFSNNISVISNNINNYTNYLNATTLYGAIDTGLYMLQNTSLAVDGKALIAFTDGGDNNTSSPTTVKNSIMNSPIPRYMIGLYGKSSDYDENVLKSLASDESKFANAANAAELQSKFDDILDQIANIIQLKYLRTTQQFEYGVDSPIEVRFRFKLY